MQYKVVVYKRIKNLGNYESEHLEMQAELEDNEDIEVATHQLRLLVNDILNKSVYPVEATSKSEFEDF